MKKNNFFTKDDNSNLPVSLEKYLFPVLSKTSPNTMYWESPPPLKISKNQIGRIILQVHQILDIFKSLQISLKNKSFLDIGTGNGMIPRLLLELSDLKLAIGSDPYLDGEHKTSWQKHNHDKTLLYIKDFLKKNCDNNLDFFKYFEFSKSENATFVPQSILF